MMVRETFPKVLSVGVTSYKTYAIAKAMSDRIANYPVSSFLVFVYKLNVDDLFLFAFLSETRWKTILL